MAQEPHNRARRSVLVLEDEAVIAMTLEDELESLGIHVVGPVSNLASAIRIAETADLDAALLDLNINGDYATEVADALRARGIPFIFVTGYSRPEGLRFRDVEVLRKPFTAPQLRAALISLLNEKKA
jgi:chemotaxis family two-component system sensor kinase Cph1